MKKSIKDKSKLVLVQRYVTMNGKTFLRGQWVKPEDVKKTDTVVKNPSGADLGKPLKTNSDVNAVLKFDLAHFNSIKGDKSKALDYLKSIGLVWKEDGSLPIRWMRAMMALKKANIVIVQPDKTNPQKKDVKDKNLLSKDQIKELDSVKDPAEKVVMLKKILGDQFGIYLKQQGISWKENSNKAINMMNMTVAAKKHFSDNLKVSEKVVEELKPKKGMSEAEIGRMSLINKIQDREVLEVISKVGIIPEDEVAEDFIKSKMLENWKNQKVVKFSEDADVRKYFNTFYLVKKLLKGDEEFITTNMEKSFENLSYYKLVNPRDFFIQSFTNIPENVYLRLYDEKGVRTGLEEHKNIFQCEASKELDSAYEALLKEGFYIKNRINFSKTWNPSTFFEKLNKMTELPEDKKFFTSTEEGGEVFSYGKLFEELVSGSKNSESLFPVEKHGFFKMLDRLEKEGSEKKSIDYMKEKYKELYGCFDNDYLLFSKFSGSPFYVDLSIESKIADSFLKGDSEILERIERGKINLTKSGYYDKILDFEEVDSTVAGTSFSSYKGDFFNIKRSQILEGLQERIYESFKTRGYTEEDIEYSMEIYLNNSIKQPPTLGYRLNNFPMYKNGENLPTFVDLTKDKFKGENSYVVVEGNYYNELGIKKVLNPIYFNSLASKGGVDFAMEKFKKVAKNQSNKVNSSYIYSLFMKEGLPSYVNTYLEVKFQKLMKKMTPEKMARASELKGELFGMEVVDASTGNKTNINPIHVELSNSYSHSVPDKKLFGNTPELLNFRLSNSYKYKKSEDVPPGFDQVLSSLALASNAVADFYFDTSSNVYKVKTKGVTPNVYFNSGMIHLMGKLADDISNAPVEHWNSKSKDYLLSLPTLSKDYIDTAKSYFKSETTTKDFIVRTVKNGGLFSLLREDRVQNDPLFSNISYKMLKSFSLLFPEFEKTTEFLDKKIKSSAKNIKKIKLTEQSGQLKSLLSLRETAFKNSNCSLKTTEHKHSEELRKDFMKNWDYEEPEKKIYSGKNSLNGEDRRVLFNSRFFEVKNSSFEKGFKTKVEKENQVPYRVYHGTSYSSTAGVLGVSGEFKWDSSVNVQAGRMLGNGVYFGKKGGKSSVYVGNEKYSSVHKKDLKEGDADGCYILCDIVEGSNGESNKSYGKKVREWEIVVKNNDCILPRYIVDVSCRNAGRLSNVKRNDDGEYLNSDGVVTHNKDGVSVTMK